MKFTTIKITTKDKTKLCKLKLHKTEPLWSIVERLIQKLGESE